MFRHSWRFSTSLSVRIVLVALVLSANLFMSLMKSQTRSMSLINTMSTQPLGTPEPISDQSDSALFSVRYPVFDPVRDLPLDAKSLIYHGLEEFKEIGGRGLVPNESVLGISDELVVDEVVRDDVPDAWLHEFTGN